MTQINYEEVNLMLRLYDLRREPRLREARAWFVENFHAGTPEELWSSILRAAKRTRIFEW